SQSSSKLHVFPLVGPTAGASSLSLPESRSRLQAPSTHIMPVLQLLSNVQAKTGVEARHMIATTIRLRMVVPSVTPKITSPNDRIWTGQAPFIGARRCPMASERGSSDEMARPKRFELLTPRFVVWCSIQLSYGRIIHCRKSARGTGHSYRLDRVLARVATRTLTWGARPRP